MAGCWTCRARKKKCGQQKPSCDECRRLGLRCDGYGKRPDWADGGRKEHDHKTQLKAFIKLRHRSKRTHSLPEPLSTPPFFDSPLDDGDDLASSDNLHDYFSEPFQSLTTHFTENKGGAHFSPLDIPLAPNENFHHSTTQVELISLQNVDSFDPESLRSSVEPTLRGSISEVCSVSYSIDECQLLSHYLDSVFWSQYPHLDQATTTVDRTWILAFFQSSREFKHALLHLSRYLQGTTNRGPVSNADMDNATCATIVGMLFERIKALHFEERSYSMELVVPLISASALAAYYGTLTDQRDCVHSSLSVAYTLLEYVRQLDGDSWMFQLEASAVPETQNHLQVALKFSITQLLWIDTFEAAVTSSSCVLQLAPIVEKLDLNRELEMLFGCRMWTIRTIREAIELALWKKTCLMGGRLSIRELVSRSEILLNKIKEAQICTAVSLNASAGPTTATNELWPISDFPSSLSLQNTWNMSTMPCESDVSILTRVYMQATAIYVHIVVSGATSSLLEIRSCISSALELMTQLRSIDMLACMMWPLLVFSCLSIHSQRERCKSILDRGVHRPKLRRACLQISGLAQKCWHLDSETPMMPWNWESVFHGEFLKL